MAKNNVVARYATCWGTKSEKSNKHILSRKTLMFHAYFSPTYWFKTKFYVNKPVMNFRVSVLVYFGNLSRLFILFLVLNFLFIFGKILKNHCVLFVKCSIFIRNWLGKSMWPLLTVGSVHELRLKKCFQSIIASSF